MPQSDRLSQAKQFLKTYDHNLDTGKSNLRRNPMRDDT
jgi:hypothetical protein